MLDIFQPKINERLHFSSHVLIWIKSGNGLIEVDFKTYKDFKDKLIFLSPGQYVKFVFGEFEVAKMAFADQFVFNSRDFRVLFKHLVSLGYIEFSVGVQQSFMRFFDSNPLNVLDLATQQWFWQNPFKADKEEYTIIFDTKEVIDEHFKENLSIEKLIANVSHEYYHIAKLVKSRLGTTVKSLALQKLLLESQKDIAFTDKPIQEVANDLGFKDPAYFNRFFKKQTHHTPLEFRRNFGEEVDTLIQDILYLIQTHHKSQHSTAFYADQTHLSIKTLSRKVKEKLHMTVGDLVRNELVNSAKTLLPHYSIKEVAYELGFEEPHHFSAFFKKYTGIKPRDYNR